MFRCAVCTLCKAELPVDKNRNCRGADNSSHGTTGSLARFDASIPLVEIYRRSP